VIQWYGDHGEVEFNSVAGSRKFNEEIDDASCFMHIVAAAKAAPVPAKP
jgi:hypothetical protein